MLTPGEYEPASFIVIAHENLRKLNFRSSVPLTDSEGKALDGATLDIRIVKRWYPEELRSSFSIQELKTMTSELLVYDDTLVKVENGANMLRMADGRYVDVSVPGNDAEAWNSAERRRLSRPRCRKFAADQILTVAEPRQMWVTLHAANRCAAGTLSGSEVEVLIGDQVQQVVPVYVEVLPFTLAEPPLEVSIYYRGRLDPKRPDGSISSEMRSEAQMLADLENMRAHGVTNPPVYQKLDTGLVDRVMQLRQEAGFNTDKLYFLGVELRAEP